MKALFCLVPFTVFALAHCGNDDSHPGSLLPGGGDTTTAAGSGHAKACRMTCSTAADCARSGSPLQDASHFTCTAGRCEWLGCKSASECSEALGSNALTCAETPGEKVPICVATCQQASDCAVSGNALGDASHFACDSGKCRWTGCKSASECVAALGSAKSTCDTPTSSAVPICVPTCQKAADCAVPGAPMSDASHFTCKAGRCEWLGCKSTTECAAAVHATNVVCE